MYKVVGVLLGILVFAGCAVPAFAQETRVCVARGSASAGSESNANGLATDDATSNSCCLPGFESIVGINPGNATCEYQSAIGKYWCTNSATFTCQKKK
jgi:hypothetical protein